MEAHPTWRRHHPDRQGKPRWNERLDQVTSQIFGPAELGPSGEPLPSLQSQTQVCDICGEPMSQHRIDHVDEQSWMTCPHRPLRAPR